MKNMFLFVGWFVLEFNHSAPVILREEEKAGRDGLSSTEMKL